MVHFTLITKVLRSLLTWPRRLTKLQAALIGSFCVALGTAAHAQRPERAASRVDSLRAARDGKPTYFPAVLTFVSGKQMPAFLPAYTTCFVERVSCYDASPERIPPPSLKSLDVNRLVAMTVDGHRYESLYLNGKPLGLLAENLAPPGPIELFGYAKTKNDMLIPIPLVIPIWVSTGTHDKYYWYLRAAPGAALREVPRGGGEFAKVMGEVFAAAPDLAARVRRQEKGARFDELPSLVFAYNTHTTIK